ncbi:hypothetical protein ABT215_22200 [Streptomyces sp900105755]|uniref:hypothetical protein n=1 Tax=Streptomyces sp. 900105755 TaxID=3154389 RepID=UPI00332FA6C6
MSRLRLRATPVGDALLVHPKGHLDERAVGFAEGLSRDPQHTLVVVDLPTGVLSDEWGAVARLLSSSRYKSLRMVFGRDRGEDVRRAAGLIADRLGREVLAADGALVPTVKGGLFVPGDDAAWLRFRPGHPAEHDSQRFPKPHWEFALPTRARAVSVRTTAQPLPSGVWLRHTDPALLPGEHRRTVETVPIDPRRLLVVLGSPDSPPLPVDDVARYWDSVLPNARPSVRFHLYGTLDIPDSLTAGQCLADALGHEVVLCAELPSGETARVGDNGTLAYVPTRPAAMLPAVQVQARGESGPTGPAPSPGTATGGSELGTDTAAAGVAGGTEIAAGDVPVIRVADPAAARSLPLPHSTPRVQMVSGNTAPPVGSVREVSGPRAAEPAPADISTPKAAAAAFGPALTDPTTAPGSSPGTAPLSPPAEPAALPPIQNGTADPDPAPAPETTPLTRGTDDPEPSHLHDPALPPKASLEGRETPVPAAAPETEPAPRPVRPAAPRFRLESGPPAPETGADPALQTPAVPPPVPEPDPAPARLPAPGTVRVQPVPNSAACAIPPERGIAKERDWLRRTFNEQYNATAGAVSRVMSETPGLRGGSRSEAADALTELVAVRLYLSGDSRTADAAVRAATAGPHVPLARCVTAGLRRLPSYRGPALLRTRLTDAERAWYQQGRLVTEWAFCHARTSLHTGPRGVSATDVLIWSMTARRTAQLDPTLTDRVLFLPGTVLKVLRTDGNTVLMREVPPSEISENGRVDVQQARLDEMAVKGLGNILDALEKAGTDATAECADPPGLIVTPDTGRSGREEVAKP